MEIDTGHPNSKSNRGRASNFDVGSNMYMCISNLMLLKGSKERESWDNPFGSCTRLSAG